MVFRIEFDNSDYIESQTIAPSAGINVKRAQISTISSKNLLAVKNPVKTHFHVKLLVLLEF